MEEEKGERDANIDIVERRKKMEKGGRRKKKETKCR
jgi:hypothetical protein